MRSLALAKAFPAGAEISFISKANPKVEDLITKSGYEIFTLEPDLDYQAELDKVKEIIKKNQVEILITDSYELEQSYLIELKEVVDKLISIHDFVPYAFPSDIVVNGNIYAPKLDYQSTTAKTDFLLGPKYTLMREEFQDLSRNTINKDIKSLLITVGGSDKLNLTPKIIKAVEGLEQDLHLDVVVGPGFENTAEILNTTQDIDLEIALHFNVAKMSELMLANDIAISAGGSTLYELAATGTPALTLLQADNQIKVAQAMAEAGTIINLGFGDKVAGDELSAELKRLTNDFQKRKEMSVKGQNLIDGQGAERTADYILHS